VSAHGIDIKTALEIVPRTTVFTTHTPVWAGHDAFSLDLVTPVIQPFAERLGTSVAEIISWGQTEGHDPKEPLSMFILGMHLSEFRNGVSALHGNTARRMWSHVWPKRPMDEIPISHITNGIHISSFISPAFADLFYRYLGPTWHMQPQNPENIDRIENISGEELWKAHELNRAHLISTCRQKLVQQYERENAPRAVIEKARSALDDDTLTIGFARRFAAYKRADLLFKDPERLEAILNSPDRPVQFIFAGKAHPKDEEGKAIIRRLVEFTRRTNVGKRIVFIEDYDMDLARHLIQGVDAWLNTPRRPLEACGTSGMKAAINGVINIGTLDGWWAEGYNEDVGWAIGLGEEYADSRYQDAIESQALYNLLENDVTPCFYDSRNGNGSGVWRTKMKSSIRMAMTDYGSLRMVSEYNSRFYGAAAENHDRLLANHAEAARQTAQQVQRYRELWQQVRIESPVRERSGAFRIGEVFSVAATVHLGRLTPDDVAVELYYGPYQQVAELQSGQTEAMTVQNDLGNGSYQYHCTLTCRQAGRFGFTARVTPRGDRRIKSTPGLITWV
jgi:starch phosphorylase